MLKNKLGGYMRTEEGIKQCKGESKLINFKFLMEIHMEVEKII